MAEGEAEFYEFYKLQETRAEHNRDADKEGKLCRHRAGTAEKHGAEYCNARTRGSGDQRKHLKHADVERGLVVELPHPGNLRLARLVPVLNQNEENAVYRQHN